MENRKGNGSCGESRPAMRQIRDKKLSRGTVASATINMRHRRGWKRRIGGDEGRRIYRWRVLATREREEKNARCWHNISEEIHGGKCKSYGGHAWIPDYYSSGIHRCLDIRQNVTHIKRINDRRPCNNEARYVLVSFYIF